MKKFAIVLIFVLLFSQAAAQAMQPESKRGIMPDSLAYPVMRAIEKIQYFFASPAEKPTLKIKFAETRLGEVETMLLKNKIKFAKSSFSEYLNEIEIIQKGFPQQAEESISKHITILQKVYEKMPDATKPSFISAIITPSKPEAESEIIKPVEGSKFRIEIEKIERVK